MYWVQQHVPINKLTHGTIIPTSKCTLYSAPSQCGCQNFEASWYFSPVVESKDDWSLSCALNSLYSRLLNIVMMTCFLLQIPIALFTTPPLTWQNQNWKANEKSISVGSATAHTLPRFGSMAKNNIHLLIMLLVSVPGYGVIVLNL